MHHPPKNVIVAAAEPLSDSTWDSLSNSSGEQWPSAEGGRHHRMIKFAFMGPIREGNVLQATTVVTSARFEQGLRYADFLAQATVNRDKFELYYKESPLSDEDISFFKKAAALPNGPGKILALAEAWCGDVYRELPTVARIAEAAGLSLRVFLRDENPDIMDEFLSNQGKARAIPVFVFYTKDTRYITHFTERSAGAHAELAAIMDRVRSQLNLPHGTTFATVPESDKQVFLREVIARITPRFPDWRKESIKEMRALLSTALKLPDGG